MHVAGASDPGAYGVFYLLTDHLGSISRTIDSSRNVLCEIRYKAWGVTRYTSVMTTTPFGYTGLRH